MTRIDHTRLVTPDQVVEDAWILVDGGRILATGTGARPPAASVIDGGGLWALAGFIDLHSDALEGETQPRPGVFFPPEVGFFSLESKLVCHGVTTMFHSLAFHDNKISMRSREMVESVIRSIRRLQSQGLIRHLVHARYEVSEVAAGPVIASLIAEGLVQLVSFMDHSPGQGQYGDLEKYRHNLLKNRGLGEVEALQWIRDRQARMTNPDIPAALAALASAARDAGIPLASHDDDRPDKVVRMRDFGVSISEFPINLPSAQAARDLGMSIVVGAPNIVRGASNSGNMRALDAVLAGNADILCSDYVPPAILYAVFQLHFEHGLPLARASAMASLNPARAAGLDHRTGSLEPGMDADLILVDRVNGIPRVELVMTGGQVVLAKGGRTAAWTREVAGVR